MKAKVLMYGSDGNKVVRKYVELEETDMNNIYTYTVDNYSYLVFRYERKDTVLFVEVSDLYNNEVETQKDKIQKHYDMFLDSWKTRFSSNLLIEAHRDLGNDIEPIIQEREKQLKEMAEKQEKEEKEREEKRLAEKKIREEENLKQANKTVEKLKSGEQVSFGDLMFAIDVLKIDVHPRTKGAMKKQNVYNRIGKESGVFDKGTRNSTAQSMFEVVAMVAS